MGGFLGIGGSSAKTDRNQTLAGYQDLNSVFNFGSKTGQNNISAGESGVGNAADYYSRLASGNRPAALAALAPQTNALNAGADAARRQNATMGTSRGGGAAGTNQQADTTKNAQIDNMLFGAQGTGVQGENQTGTEQASEGQSLLNTGANAAQSVTGDSITSRPQSYDINKKTQSDVFNAVSVIPDAAKLISNALFAVGI